MRAAIFCDFDDTVTRTNVTDAVLDKFADPLWLEIQEDWLAGKLTAREVLEKQMPLIKVDAEELNAFVDTVAVDPGFFRLWNLCTDRKHGLYILSDGFDYWIERILRLHWPGNGKPEFERNVFACHLEPTAERVSISFPFYPEGCPHGCATCKPALFRSLRNGATKTVVIGDGVSDFLIAREADLVFAKGALGEFCRREGIAFQSYDDLHDIAQSISGWP